MAKKIRKNKNLKLFFLVLGLLLSIGILVFSNYISKTSTSTDTKAAGRGQCTSYQSKRGCPKNLGCVPSGKWCKFGGTSNGSNQQTTSTSTSTGRSPVKTSAGYCLSGLDCNVDGQAPTGSYPCPAPYIRGNQTIN